MHEIPWAAVINIKYSRQSCGRHFLTQAVQTVLCKMGSFRLKCNLEILTVFPPDLPPTPKKFHMAVGEKD